MKKFLKFEATWCNTCKQLDKILKDAPFTIEHIDVDEDKNESIVEQYKIKSLPTIIMLKDNMEVKRFNGLVSLKELIEEWNTL